MSQSPLERHVDNYRAINIVLGDGSDPVECASVVAASLLRDILKVESLRPPPDNAPRIMHELFDVKAWERFFPEDNPGPNKWVWELKRLHRAAYAIFTAAGCASDKQATAILFTLGASLMADIITLESRRAD